MTQDNADPASEAETPAQRMAQEMWGADRASRALGMELISVGPGRADLAMTVRDDMINGHGTCHGGLIFTLADSAFGIACNSYGPTTVAQNCEIAFLKPPKLGDRLIASAREVWRKGRNGIYDIDIRDGAGEHIALFRGKSLTIAKEAPS